MAETKSLIVSSSERTMLNPCWFHFVIYPYQKVIESGNRVDYLGPFLMTWQMVVRDHSGTTSTGKPLGAYSLSREISEWTSDRTGLEAVGCCAELR